MILMNYYCSDYLSKLDLSLTSDILTYPTLKKWFYMTTKIIDGKQIAHEIITS